MTKQEMWARYLDAKGQVEFTPPTRISGALRGTFRVRHYRFQPTLGDENFRWATDFERISKAGAEKILVEGYGLTAKQFIACAIQSWVKSFSNHESESSYVNFLKKRYPYAF